MNDSGEQQNVQEYEQRRMAVVDAILAEPEGFDMMTWGRRSTATTCGTVACLAGTAVLQAAAQGLCGPIWHRLSDFDDFLEDMVFTDGGRRSVDLDLFAANYLGLPGPALFYRCSLTAEEAAKELLDAPYVTTEP